MTWEREQIGACTLYRGDAMEVLPTLEAIDHVLTDPPWKQAGHQIVHGGAHLAPLRHANRTLAPDALGLGCAPDCLV